MAAMTFFIGICPVFFIFFGGTVRCDNNNFLRNYVSLMIAIHERHPTSSLCFLTSHKTREMEEFSVANMLTREFSRNGVQTLTTNLDEIAKRMNYYNERDVDSPFVVVLIRAERDIKFFHNNTLNMPISYPTWLLIFEDALEPRICQYCEDPAENIFGLRYDTKMFVLCCNNPVLKEWWSVRGIEVAVADFGTWTLKNGFELIATEALYERRSEIGGDKLRLIIVKKSILCTLEGGTVRGFFGDIVTELSRVMNFEIDSITGEELFGSWDSETESWSGAIDRVIAGEADLGVGEFSITTHRLQVVDFTLPLLLSRTLLFFKEPDSSTVQWSAHFKAFQYQIWLATLLLVITGTVLVALIKKRLGARCFLHLLVDNYLSVWGIFCQQGLIEFPTNSTLRLTYFSIFISALVVSAAYSASLISFLTVSNAALPFSTIEEYAEDGSYDLTVLQDSADYDLFETTPDPILLKMKEFMRSYRYLPLNIEEAFEQVCTEKVVFISNEAAVRATNVAMPCKMIEIATGRMDSLGLILPLGSQYTGVMNNHIQRFQDTGLLSRLKTKYFAEGRVFKSDYNRMSLWGVAPILSVLAAGSILALVILLGEKCFALTRTWRLRRSRRWESEPRTNFYQPNRPNRARDRKLHAQQNPTRCIFA